MNYTTPANYTVFQLRVLVALAKAEPESTFTPRSFAAPTMTAAQYLKWFRARLSEKINVKGGIVRTGRKHSYQYQTELRRDAWRLKGPCGLGKVLTTPEVRARLGADHVHWHCGGTHRSCSDRDCENRN